MPRLTMSHNDFNHILLVIIFSLDLIKNLIFIPEVILPSLCIPSYNSHGVLFYAYIFFQLQIYVFYNSFVIFFLSYCRIYQVWQLCHQLLLMITYSHQPKGKRNLSQKKLLRRLLLKSNLKLTQQSKVTSDNIVFIIFAHD